MKINRQQLKEIIREELLSERSTKSKFKTPSGHKITIDAIRYELTISTNKSDIKIKGWRDLGDFAKLLSKNLRIH